MLASKQIMEEMGMFEGGEDKITNFSQNRQEIGKIKISNSQYDIKNKVSYALLERLKK